MEGCFQRVLKELAICSIRKEHINPELLTKELYEKYPKHLFKYKGFRGQGKQYTFEMLEKEYLWADLPSNFDDSSDSRIAVPDDSREQLIRWYNSHLAEIWFYSLKPVGMKGKKYGHTLQDYLDVQAKFIDEKGVVKKQKCIEAFSNMLVSMPKKEVLELRRLVKGNMIPDVPRLLAQEWESKSVEMVNSFRNDSHIACVTKDYKNRKMWEDYADKYKGIVIEFCLPRYEELSDEQKRMFLHLFPVSYRNPKRIPRISLMPLFEWEFQRKFWNREIELGDFLAKLYEQVLYKEKDYSFEKEWRFVDCSNENKIPFPFVKRVYAGYKISKQNLQKLKRTCKQKGFELYLQKEDVTRRELIYVKCQL